jgi:hypothetical protein
MIRVDGEEEHMEDETVPGPVDFVLVEFPEGADTSGVVDVLGALVEQGIVRLYDVALLRRADGVGSRLDLGDPGAVGLGGFAAFAGAQSGLFDDEDTELAIGILDENTTGLLLAYENAWAIPFVGAANRAGGQLVASQRISAQVLLDALDTAG